MEFRYDYNGTIYTVNLEAQADGGYTAQIGDRTYQINIQRSQPGQLNLIIDKRRLHAYTSHQRNEQTDSLYHYIALVDREAQMYELITPQVISRRPHATASSGQLKAQMPGQVMQVLVKENDEVEQGQALLILEAMKMEIRVQAPHSGIVTRLSVAEGDTIERGQLLADIALNA